ncbi:MAG: HPr family phosphocarrier protein [Anaerolineaceae bacterium]|nr:HPr family phosphocarrier protein [Anaerolineaceae bacterium]
MPEVKTIVNHKVGLHARPAATFVKTANQYKSDIQITKEDRTVNAKSILSVLTLGVNHGTEVMLHAEGEDADAALQALVALIEDNFGEEE